MAFAGASIIVDGEPCEYCGSNLSPVDAGADSGYHLLVVRGYSRARQAALSDAQRDCIRSSPFVVGGHRWNLEFYPSAYDDEREGEFISVFLVLDPSSVGSESVEARFVFSFIDQPELRASLTTSRQRSQTFTKFDNGHGAERFARTEFLATSRHLKDDSLTIRCDVVVINNNNDSTKKEQGSGGTINASHFGSLLVSKEGADITFLVDGKEFAAHRCVLAARSAVFKAQLFADMDTAVPAASVVKIDGINADVFAGMLTFIYTGAMAMPDLKGNNMAAGDDPSREEAAGETAWLLQLLEASDQCGIQRLKAVCEEILACRYVWAASVADIVGVAQRRGCLWLKEECLEFIKSHTRLPSLFAPAGLEMIITDCSPSVLKELLSKFASSTSKI